MTDKSPTRVLFVDDEPNLLAGLTRSLHGLHYEVTTATSGRQGLEAIREKGPFAVVTSDLRMPEMDGITFLRLVREVAPDSVRVLFTGHLDLQSAIATVNEGHIFRFVTKPCPAPLLCKTLESAAEQYRLVTTERVLLQDTLRGSIETLTDILALTNPAAFGQAQRIRQSVSALATHFHIQERWQAEVAAMLSQIGCVTLPSQTQDKLYHGEPLSEAEQTMVDRMPAVVEQLLGRIPRLEPVRDILCCQHKHFDGSGKPHDRRADGAIPWGARALKIALDLDTLEAQGLSKSLAFDTMRGRKGWYDPALLEGLAQLRGGTTHQSEIRELPLVSLMPGMILAEDVKTRGGLLLIARGQEVTASLLGKIRNFSPGLGIKEPIRVVVSGALG